MSRLLASISQPSLKARTKILGLAAEIGGNAGLKARAGKSISLRAEFGVGFNTVVWIWMDGFWNDDYPWLDSQNWRDS